VPAQRRIKPGISQGANFSSPSRQDRIQIVSVREVSIVDLYAAEAYLVQAMPNELNSEIEKIVKMMSPMIQPFSVICLKANDEFSR
jgi:hypothetical protein